MYVYIHTYIYIHIYTKVAYYGDRTIRYITVNRGKIRSFPLWSQLHLPEDTHTETESFLALNKMCTHYYPSHCAL
jgi:hypothetical protein